MLIHSFLRQSIFCIWKEIKRYTFEHCAIIRHFGSEIFISANRTVRLNCSLICETVTELNLCWIVECLNRTRTAIFIIIHLFATVFLRISHFVSVISVFSILFLNSVFAPFSFTSAFPKIPTTSMTVFLSIVALHIKNHRLTQCNNPT